MPDATRIRGIDVSAVQEKIDWVGVAATGVKFAYLRCGVGNGPPDARFGYNAAVARSVDLVVGAYHLAYPLPTDSLHPGRDPVDQCKMHYVYCGGRLAGDLRPALDLEWPEPKDWAKWGCTASQIRSWALAYLAQAELMYGGPPVLYTYPDFAMHVDLGACPEFARYPLWVASYRPDHPLQIAPWSGWSVWQTSGGGGALPGGVPVDTDIIADSATLESLRMTAPDAA